MNSPKETKEMIWLLKQIFVKGSVYRGFYPYDAQYVYALSPSPREVSYIKETDVWVCLDSKPTRNEYIFRYEILTKDGSGYVGFNNQNADGWIPALKFVLARRIYKPC